MRNEVDIDILPELLKLGDLGIQYCLKTEKALQELRSMKDRLMSVQWMQKRYTIISWKMINMNQSREKRREDLLRTGSDRFFRRKEN